MSSKYSPVAGAMRVLQNRAYREGEFLRMSVCAPGPLPPGTRYVTRVRVMHS